MPSHMMPLNSTSLSAAGYEPETKVLQIRFANGRTYTYEGVPQDVYDALLAADSPGTYFNAAIRGVYG